MTVIEATIWITVSGFVGAIIGYMAAAIIATGANADRVEEAFRLGYEAGTAKDVG